MAYYLEEKKGLKLFFFESFRKLGVDAFFTTRSGGFSQEPFATLNLALHVNDDPNTVVKNRQKLISLWGLEFKNFVTAEQVHGTEIAIVDRGDGGRGIFDLKTALKKTDGLITGEKNLGLLTFYADCVPLYFFSPDPFLIGVAHAGWRGSLAKIGEKMVNSFVALGAKTQNLFCGIGPAIGPCCYQVGAEVANKFIEQGYKNGVILKNQEHYLNLWEINAEILIRAGVPPENIEKISVCTSCHPELFFSYRRDGGITGRMAAGIIKREV